MPVKVAIPFITNTEAIKADDRIVLKWAVKAKPGKAETGKKTWHDDPVAHDTRRRKVGKRKGGGEPDD